MNHISIFFVYNVFSFDVEPQTNLTMQLQRYQHHQVEPIDFVLFFQTIFPSSLVHGRPIESSGNLLFLQPEVDELKNKFSHNSKGLDSN